MRDRYDEVDVASTTKEIKVVKYTELTILNRASATKWSKETALSHKHTFLVPFKIHYFIGRRRNGDNSYFKMFFLGRAPMR